VQQQRNAGQPGGHATRAGGEAAHAQHHIGRMVLSTRRACSTDDDAIGRREQTLDAVATHPWTMKEMG
jgi:hypothetical protein